MQMKTINRVLKGTAIALAASLVMGGAVAQTDYPNRPIKMVVAYPAGQGTDINARYMAEELSKALGQPVVVDNKAGASGNIGTAYAARATPDGYTILMGASGTHAMNPALFSQPGFDALNDFIPIAATIVIPMAISAHPSIGVKNIPELMAWAKKQNKEIDIAIPSVTAQMVLELLKEKGAPFNVIRYKGASDAQTAVLGNQVPILIDTLAASRKHFGKLNPIAVTSPKSVASVPGVQSVAEQGYPGFSVTAWNVLYALKGTPQPIVDKLRSAMKTIMDKPETLVAINKFGFEKAEWMSADQLQAFVKAEFDQTAKVVQKAGMKIN